MLINHCSSTASRRRRNKTIGPQPRLQSPLLDLSKRTAASERMIAKFVPNGTEILSVPAWGLLAHLQNGGVSRHRSPSRGPKYSCLSDFSCTSGLSEDEFWQHRFPFVTAQVITIL